MPSLRDGVLRWRAGVAALRLLHGWSVVRQPDRVWLERDLFHQLRRERDPEKLLFVGAAEYTRWYHRLFERGAVETIDIDESVARHGSPTRHVVGSCTDLSAHWPDGYFDAVVFNGVYGWGVDSDDDLRRTLTGIRAVLRPGGLLVFGFNDDEELDPLHVLSNRARYFADFESATLGGLWIVGFERYRRHTYLFFRPRSA